MPEVSIQIVESRAPAPLKRFQEAGKNVMHSSSLTVVLPVSVLEDAQWPAMGPIDGRTQPPKDEDEEAQLEELRRKRQEKLEAVQALGGFAAGKRQTGRQRARWMIEGWKWQLFLLVVAFIDLAMLFVELNAGPGAIIPVAVVTFIVLSIFVVDLLIRYYAFRNKLFNSFWFWFDFLVVAFSIVLFLVGLGFGSTDADVGQTGSTAARGGKALRGMIIALRWLRAARLVMKLTQVKGGASKAARHATGENKKRYVDLEHGFDLDLAYVLPDLIAMSVPAIGWTALYRNPLPEVARFLELRHGKGGYTIINCCPELPYPPDKFKSGEVVRFDIQDHTPPSMLQFVEFLNSMRHKLASHTLAIHCRGGKGRTGSMCCAWLLYSRACLDADDALTHFALERTELSLGRKKIQGVDTPSQRRYVHQLDALLRAQSAYLTEPTRRRRAPASTSDAQGEESVTSLREESSSSSSSCRSPDSRPVGSLVRPPACPTASMRSLDLVNWYAKAPKGALVCAVHRNGDVGEDRGKVVHWSPPVHDFSTAGSSISFDLSGVDVDGDVRVSVFALDDLLKVRRKRLKKGLAARPPFDGAPTGPWEDTADTPTTAPETAEMRKKKSKKDDKRVIAGKESGCKFFLLFHTGFVSSTGALPVPLKMMDKAFKNKGKKYNPEGVATLRFELLEKASIKPTLGAAVEQVVGAHEAELSADPSTSSATRNQGALARARKASGASSSGESSAMPEVTKPTGVSTEVTKPTGVSTALAERMAAAEGDRSDDHI